MDPVLDRMRATLTSGGRLWIVGTLTRSRAGRPRPMLPPPPRPGTGWSIVPDLGEWSMDAGDFVRAHAVSVRMAFKPAGHEALEESPTLAVVEGWRP